MDRSLTHDELHQIAAEGYLFLYPLVLMEMTRRVSTNVAPGEKISRGPMNTLVHARAFPPGHFRTVVRPNFDTLYSSAWLDLSDEPYVISVPVIQDRFFTLPLYDMWTDVFAAPGTRTHGRGPLTFALCTPRWRGPLPEGVQRINAPTRVVWVLGRTETRGVDDFDHVHALQDQIHLTPLSTWPAHSSAPFVRDLGVDMKTPPMIQVEHLSAHEFFSLGADLVALHQPHPTDWGMTARLARAGFVVGRHFTLDSYEVDVREAFESAREAAADLIRQHYSSVTASRHGWTSITDLGVWGNAYLKRAMIAMTGLGANPPEESIYPNAVHDANGDPLNGARRYRMHFAPEGLPPADAFWSITPYDAHGYPVENEIGRYALGDRDALNFSSDGSLELILSTTPPSEKLIANWLPIPSGAFVLTMRLYLPRREALTGHWSPPGVEPIA